MIDIQRAFDVLDRDHDGKINKQDLYYGYHKMYGSNTHQIDEIYNRIDVDNSGQIDYTEWVIATIDKESLLTEDKLRTAFNMIDDDGSGTITSHEIRDVICAGNQNIDPELWDKMIMEVDLDGNGEIDYDEFKVVMRKIILRPNKDKEKSDKKKQEEHQM